MIRRADDSFHHLGRHRPARVGDISITVALCQPSASPAARIAAREALMPPSRRLAELCHETCHEPSKSVVISADLVTRKTLHIAAITPRRSHFKTGRAWRPHAWKVRFLRRVVPAGRPCSVSSLALVSRGGAEVLSGAQARRHHGGRSGTLRGQYGSCGPAVVRDWGRAGAAVVRREVVHRFQRARGLVAWHGCQGPAGLVRARVTLSFGCISGRFAAAQSARALSEPKLDARPILRTRPGREALPARCVSSRSSALYGAPLLCRRSNREI